MSTSGPVQDKADAPADDDDDAATVAADERNDNESARDAAATALWTRCLEHAGTSPRDQKIPTHVAVLKDIHGADYSTLLKCPLDDRSEHPYGQKGERKLAATGALARCRIEFFASDGPVPARHADGLDSLFNGGRAADGRRLAGARQGEALEAVSFSSDQVHARPRALW